MAYGIRMEVWGEYAAFNRPEMKVERVSYDIMTPSAARGILEAIYWKPEMRWVIDEIHVLSPIRFTNIRRNEVGGTIAKTAVGSVMNSGEGSLGVDVSETRQQRAGMILKDVRYGIAAHVEILDPGDNPVPEAKHLEMFKRRASRGQYFHHPYLGTREFPASFELVREFSDPAQEILTDSPKDLGYMLLDIDYVPNEEGTVVESNRGRRLEAIPRFFRAEMVEGVVKVPPMPRSGGE